MPAAGSAQAQNAAAPSVTAVALTSDAGDDDTYILGDTISVTLTFSEAVEVTGTPQVAIDMDPAAWGTKRAAYASGTGTSSLTFAHTVVEPNYSTQGIAVLEDTLELNGGTIRSVASQTDAGLSHDGLGHDPDHKVDWRISPPAPDAPTVTGVAVSSDAGDDDTYVLGDTISVTLTFSEAVDVTGTPQVAIDMDPAAWGTKRAGYASGTGTSSLTFAHTVVQPNYSTQGIAVLEDTLELNGGTIQSVASQTDAALAHDGLDHDAGHKVDWTLTTATEPACALVAPSSVSGTGSGAGAVVTWTLPEDLDDACEVTGFVVGAVSDSGSIEDRITDPDARSHTMEWLPAGDYRFSVRIVYGEGASTDLVTAQANSGIGACITLAVEPYSVAGYTGNAVAGTLTPVSGTGCGTRSDFEIQMKRTADDHWNSTGRFSAYWPHYRAGGPDRPDFILGGRDPYVSYDFKVIAYDKSTSNPGRYETNAVSVAIVSSDPSVTADANSPGNLRVEAYNHSGALAKWDEPTVAAGRTLSAYVVEWKTETGAAMTEVLEPATSGNPGPFENRRQRITGLTNGERYTVRVAARTHPTDDDSTTADAWSVPSPYVTAWSEPTQVWFTNGTPLANLDINFLFFMSDTNKRWSTTSCNLDYDGSTEDLNCPRATLVQKSGLGTNISIDAVNTLDGTDTTTATQEGVKGGPPAFAIYASGGNLQFVVAWDGVASSSSTTELGEIDAYIVQHRASGATSWTTTTLEDADARSHTITGLTSGTWEVRVRARSVNSEDTDNDPTTDPVDVHYLGFTSEVLKVPVNFDQRQTSTPSDIRVTPGDSQSLIVEWDPGDEGAHPHGYQVRHKLATDTTWTTSETIYARNVRRICNDITHGDGCENPRSFEITGLTGGSEYQVEVRLNSANGWTGWVRAAEQAKPND